jgi:hypothetical protein
VAEEFHRLEESLKSYLADSQADRHNSQHANMSKYNNLSGILGTISASNLSKVYGVQYALSFLQFKNSCS